MSNLPEKLQSPYSAAVLFLEDHPECRQSDLQKHLGIEKFTFQSLLTHLKNNDEVVVIRKSGDHYLRHRSYGLSEAG
ncbi:MAG: hypothetical protein H7222_16390 [Methylotenera sp.]|nr:hypothetical protein [Oligoflexia bacterium]